VACSAEVTTEHTYLALITSSEESGDYGETLACSYLSADDLSLYPVVDRTDLENFLKTYVPRSTDEMLSPGAPAVTLARGNAPSMKCLALRPLPSRGAGTASSGRRGGLCLPCDCSRR
jgi:hypothetical protein